MSSNQIIVIAITLLLVNVVHPYTSRVPVSRRTAFATASVLLPNISILNANAQGHDSSDVLLATIKGANEALTSLCESSSRNKST